MEILQDICCMINSKKKNPKPSCVTMHVKRCEMTYQIHIMKIRRNPIQKTETELTFWYVLPDFIHSEPLQSKQKQKQVCTHHI